MWLKAINFYNRVNTGKGLDSLYSLYYNAFTYTESLYSLIIYIVLFTLVDWILHLNLLPQFFLATALKSGKLNI